MLKQNHNPIVWHRKSDYRPDPEECHTKDSQFYAPSVTLHVWFRPTSRCFISMFGSSFCWLNRASFTVNNRQTKKTHSIIQWHPYATLNCQIRQELSHGRIQLRKQSAKMNGPTVCVRERVSACVFFTCHIDVTTFRVGDNESDQRREQQHDRKKNGEQQAKWSFKITRNDHNAVKKQGKHQPQYINPIHVLFSSCWFFYPLRSFVSIFTPDRGKNAVRPVLFFCILIKRSVWQLFFSSVLFATCNRVAAFVRPC